MGLVVTEKLFFLFDGKLFDIGAIMAKKALFHSNLPFLPSMSMLKIPLYALLLCGALSAYAQAPGYLGKRFTLQADVHGVPGLGGPTADNRGSNHYGDDGGGFAFNWRAGGQVGYAISRNRQVVLGVDYLKTGMLQDAYTPYFDPFNETYSYDEHYLFYNLTGLTVHAGMRKFRLMKGALAPMGAYGGWQLQYTRVTGEILDKRTYYYSGSSNEGHAPLGIKPQMNFMALGLEFGTNYILADRVLLDVGARFNLPLSLGLLSDKFKREDNYGTPESADDYQKFNQDVFRENAAYRIWVHSLVTFHVGVGLLLF